MSKEIKELFEAAGIANVLHKHGTGHVAISGNKVIGSSAIEGLDVKVQESDDSIALDITVKAGVVIKEPVHMCFGMLSTKGVQKIVLNMHVEEKAEISIMAHCTFPNAENVEHLMDAVIRVDKDAKYKYFERHVHSEHGGLKVIPKAKILLGENARFKTEFELLKGRVGYLDVDYEAVCKAHSVMEMNAKISGRGDDIIKIKEVGVLEGEYAKGVLTSRIAVRDNAKAEIYNKMTALAPYSCGHVDCKEIIQGNGQASAIPIVEVMNEKAHVTHEAAIGSVDNKQLDTLMSRGLSEDDAVDAIINGMLS